MTAITKRYWMIVAGIAVLLVILWGMTSAIDRTATMTVNLAEQVDALQRDRLEFDKRLRDLKRMHLLAEHRSVSNTMYEIRAVELRRGLTHMERHWLTRLKQEQTEIDLLLTVTATE